MGILLAKVSGLQVQDDNGASVSGPQLSVFEAGTSTPVTTYSDSETTTPQAAPHVGNASGYFGDVYTVDGGPFRIVVADSLGATLFEVDDYTPPGTAAGQGKTTWQKDTITVTSTFSTADTALQPGPGFSVTPQILTSKLCVFGYIEVLINGTAGAGSEAHFEAELMRFDGTTYQSTEVIIERHTQAANTAFMRTRIPIEYEMTANETDPTSGDWVGRVDFRSPNATTVQIALAKFVVEEIDP